MCKPWLSTHQLVNGCNNPSFNNMFSFGNVFRRWLSTHQLVNGCSSPASKCVFLWKCMQTVPERTSTLNGYSNQASTYLGAQMLSRVSRCVRRRMYTIVSTYGGVCVYKCVPARAFRERDRDAGLGCKNESSISQVHLRQSSLDNIN